MNNVIKNSVVLLLSFSMIATSALAKDRPAKNKKNVPTQKEGFRDTDPVKGNPNPMGKEK